MNEENFKTDFLNLLEKNGLGHVYESNALKNIATNKSQIGPILEEMGKYIPTAIRFKNKPKGAKVVNMFNAAISQLFDRNEELYNVKDEIFALIDKHAGKKNKDLFSITKDKINKSFDESPTGKIIKLNNLNNLNNHIIIKIDQIDQAQSKDETRKTQKELDGLIKEHQSLRKSAGVSYELGENSKLYKLLMSGNEKTVTRLIDKILQAEKMKASEDITINPQALIKNAPPELLLKINEISNNIEVRKGGKVSSFKDGLNKFTNGLKKVFSFGFAGINEQEIKDAIKELDAVSKKFENTKQNTTDAKKPIFEKVKFADSLKQKDSQPDKKDQFKSSNHKNHVENLNATKTGKPLLLER